MKAVFVLIRHGNRFPSGGQPGNKSFPSYEEFWEQHGMHITNQGVKQLEDFGAQLAQQYPDMISHIRMFSSNTTRTILSAMSLLHGLSPSSSHHIECGEIGHSQNSVRISVEKNREDPLFHLNKSKIQKWKKQNISSSPLIKQLENNERIVNLLDKLYTMCHCENIDPCKPTSKRLYHIPSYVNLVRYGRDHNSTILPNRHDITLSNEEKQLIISIGDVVYRHYFVPHSLQKSEETGSRVCSMLLNELCKRMKDGTTRGFYIYSAHDTTLLALSAAFGLLIPCPDFASYYVFELYEDGTLNVKVNTRPKEQRLKDLNAIYWPVDEKFIELRSVEEGSFSVQEFCGRFSYQNYSNLPFIVENWIRGNLVSHGLEEIVFDYYANENDEWDDGSMKNIFYRFDAPCIKTNGFRMTREKFNSLK